MDGSSGQAEVLNASEMIAGDNGVSTGMKPDTGEARHDLVVTDSLGHSDASQGNKNVPGI